ncbi:unnamed protein product [marine sediment metagenome]|uniref:Uncharacterized protein n=1 Tax=marine sediment metagenome TaxID=412755 RepID=X1AH27_9ZZZZ
MALLCIIKIDLETSKVGKNRRKTRMELPKLVMDKIMGYCQRWKEETLAIFDEWLKKDMSRYYARREVPEMVDEKSVISPSTIDGREMVHMLKAWYVMPKYSVDGQEKGGYEHLSIYTRTAPLQLPDDVRLFFENCYAWSGPMNLTRCTRPSSKCRLAESEAGPWYRNAIEEDGSIYCNDYRQLDFYSESGYRWSSMINLNPQSNRFGNVVIYGDRFCTLTDYIKTYLLEQWH